MSSPAQSPEPNDAALRREVLGPAQSWMLQAPAGSGKTELLMQRFLACLATVEQPESVLAITFTRKAASEMRNRIVSALQKAGELSVEEIRARPPHERKSLELARKVLGVSAELGWNILSHPARLQVRTLDSFCEAVAQRAPLKGMLGGVAQVTEDAQPLYKLAAQRAIDELASDERGDAIAILLKHRDNNVGELRDLLAGMLEQREQWLHFLGRSDALDRAQQQVLRERLEAALALAVEEELALIRRHAAAVFSAAQQDELFCLMRYRAAQADAAAAALVDEPGVARIDSIAATAEVLPISQASVPPGPSRLRSSLTSERPAHPLRDIDSWPEAVEDALPAWCAIAEFLLTADNALRKTVNKQHGFPSGTKEEKAVRNRCIALLTQIAQHSSAAEFCEALQGVRRLPEPRYSEQQWEFMLALLEVLPRAAAHLQVVFFEQAAIDFAEYARRALDAIGERGDPTELGLQLGYRIRHILVDEFQDTNHAQVELLARLLHTWEDDEPCSIFCVGDPMQSIYAFRQADIAVYQQTRREGVGGKKPRAGCLSRNFRSQAKLVAWFNQVFPEIFGEPSDLTNAVAYAEAEETKPALEGAAVAIRGFAAKDRAGEARHLAECIQRELEIGDASTIAVLVRARAHLPELVEALRAARIPYRAVKTDRLAERPLVRDLEALRVALTDLADRTAWLAILRAPWCGLELADLLELCRNDEHSTVCELLRARGARLSRHAQIALARCLPVLEDALDRRGRGGLRAWLESTWLRLGGPACLDAYYSNADGAQGVRDAEAYFALLDEQAPTGNLRDPENFAAKLRELFAPADPRSGIRVEVMPIHQAKGLEWDVVFLPALERRVRADDKRLLYWRRRRRGEQELLLLGPMEAAGKKKDRKAATIEAFLRGLAGDCSREELKRLFYVAATRARQRLYLSAASDAGRQPDSNSMLRLLWELPGMQPQFAPVEAAQLSEAAQLGEAAQLMEADSAAQVQDGSAPEKSAASDPAPEILLRRLPSTLVAPPLPRLPAPLQWSAPQAKATRGEQHRFEWVGELLPRIGVVAHSFLQRIATEGLPLWDQARLEAARPAIAAALANAGVAPGELDEGVRRVSQALGRTLCDERGRWLLAPHEQAHCELAVSAVLDGEVQRVRIDRTFVEEGTRWLIDYKITERMGGDAERFVQMQVEKYRPDMDRYARVLRALDARTLDVRTEARRAIRCALYLPLQGQFCEVAV